jgi:hypothetical protein
MIIITFVKLKMRTDKDNRYDDHDSHSVATSHIGNLERIY